VNGRKGFGWISENKSREVREVRCFRGVLRKREGERSEPTKKII